MNFCSSWANVGPFYILNGQILSDKVSVKNARLGIHPGTVVDDIATNTVLHVEQWKNILKENPKLTSVLSNTSDHEYVPRGRVLYDIKNNKYLILIDKKFKSNKKIIEKIVQEFSLPKNYKVMTDDHYQSSFD